MESDRMSISRIGEMVAQPGKEDALKAFIERVIVPAIESAEGGRRVRFTKTSLIPRVL